MNTNTKKFKTRHKITFDGRVAQDVAVVSLAMLGMTTKAIAEHTGLTEAQVQYRVSKAQRGEGIAIGYRGAWRTGSSPIHQQVKRLILPSVRNHVKTALPPLFITPPVEGVAVP